MKSVWRRTIFYKWKRFERMVSEKFNWKWIFFKIFHFKIPTRNKFTRQLQSTLNKCGCTIASLVDKTHLHRHSRSAMWFTRRYIGSFRWALSENSENVSHLMNIKKYAWTGRTKLPLFVEIGTPQTYSKCRWRTFFIFSVCLAEILFTIETFGFMTENENISQTNCFFIELFLVCVYNALLNPCYAQFS